MKDNTQKWKSNGVYGAYAAGRCAANTIADWAKKLDSVYFPQTRVVLGDDFWQVVDCGRTIANWIEEQESSQWIKAAPIENQMYQQYAITESLFLLLTLRWA